MGNCRIIALEKRFILQSYLRQPAALVRGSGSWVWDADGRRYLDFLTGIAVNTLGHRHPAVQAALRRQLSRITHVGNHFYCLPQVELARELVRLSFARKVAFANSGAEANELCIKLARKWGGPRGRYEILAFQGSFHGRTYGALSATGQKNLQQGLGPMLPGFRYARYNDLASARRGINQRSCAVMVEPVQGEGGVRPASQKFLCGLRELCDRKGLLLIADEVQTGLGRCGRLFAYQRLGRRFLPDVLSLGKALGGGLPLSAVLIGRRAEGLIGPGEHGTTLGGNAVACAAGLAMLDEICRRRLDRRAERLGDWMLEQLRRLQARLPLIREVRGWGLMLGLELAVPASPAVAEALRRGLIINATAENVVRLLPPLTVRRAELQRALEILEQALPVGRT